MADAGRGNASSPTRTPNPSIASPGNDSFDNDSAFYAFGDDWDLPPAMTAGFSTFLHQKAGVPIEFIQEFEQAALVWDMESFMRWFSMGSTYAVATRFGPDFCMKYPFAVEQGLHDVMHLLILWVF